MSDSSAGIPPNPYQPGQSGVSPFSRPPQSGDATGGVIPYKNAPALIAYYLAIFSLLPCVGFFTGVPAVILGILGIRKRAQNPAVKGSVHAWIGICLGGACALLWGAVMLLTLLGMAAAR